MNNVNFFKQSLLITAPTAIQGTDIADIFLPWIFTRFTNICFFSSFFIIIYRNKRTVEQPRNVIKAALASLPTAEDSCQRY